MSLFIEWNKREWEGFDLTKVKFILKYSHSNLLQPYFPQTNTNQEIFCNTAFIASHSQRSHAENEMWMYYAICLLCFWCEMHNNRKKVNRYLNRSEAVTYIIISRFWDFFEDTHTHTIVEDTWSRDAQVRIKLNGAAIYYIQLPITSMLVCRSFLSVTRTHPFYCDYQLMMAKTDEF